jgi:soluble lytic murein transglycosylase-like protein
MLIKSDPTSLLAQQEKWAMKPHDDERKSAIKSAVEQRQARHNAIVANLPRSERMAALKATQEDYEQQIADANSGYDTKVGEYRKSRDAAAAKANGTTDPVSEDMQSQHQAVLDGDSRGTIPGIGPRFSTSVKPDEIKAKVRAAAERHGVPAEVALGVADYESGFKNFNGKLVTDKKSAHYGDRALGPMQLMDKTAKGLGVDRQDLDGNIDGGTKYLAQLYKQTGSWDEARRRYLGLGKKGDGNGTTADKYLEETKKRAEKYSGDAKLSRLDSAPSLAATDATPKKSATAISAPTDKLPENVAPPVDSPLSKVSYQDKVPSGMGGGSGTFGFDPMRFEGVFQLQDHSGRQIAEPILRTGVSAPRLVSA